MCHWQHRWPSQAPTLAPPGCPPQPGLSGGAALQVCVHRGGHGRPGPQLITDVKAEAGKYGEVKGVAVPRPPSTVTALEGARCYIKFSCTAEAEAAHEVLSPCHVAPHPATWPGVPSPPPPPHPATRLRASSLLACRELHREL